MIANFQVNVNFVVEIERWSEMKELKIGMKGLNQK